MFGSNTFGSYFWVTGPAIPSTATVGSEFVDSFIARAVVRLPEDCYVIERSTWNNEKILPLRSRELEESDSRYELNTGEVQAYVLDKDGVRNLRKWKVPAAPYVPYTFDANSDDGFGILRDLSGIVDGLTPTGDWGDIVSPDGIEIFEDFGIVGPVYNDTNAVRIEYRRRGVDLSDSQQLFEIPDRYLAYIRAYAMAKALDREGPGQDKELAAFWMSRYQAGLERMKRRRAAVDYQRTVVMGSGPKPRRQPALARLPYHFGRVVR